MLRFLGLSDAAGKAVAVAGVFAIGAAMLVAVWWQGGKSERDAVTIQRKQDAIDTRRRIDETDLPDLSDDAAILERLRQIGRE